MENHLLKNLFLDNGLTPKKIDYLTSLRLGWDELKKKSFKEVSRNSGSELVENGLKKSFLKLKYFD